MSKCPHPACEKQAKPGQLACREHWFALPKPLRDAIWETWRNRARDGMRAWSANVLEARKFWAGSK
jgi:hypothetical protein